MIKKSFFKFFYKKVSKIISAGFGALTGFNKEKCQNLSNVSFRGNRW